MAISAEDRALMGTPEEAHEALVALARQWRELRQPLIAPAKEQKARDQQERHVRFQIANSALHWLWHQENPTPANRPREQGMSEQINAIAKAIRDEIDREYRDDDRRKCRAGIRFWEEEIQPMLLAEAAMRAATLPSVREK